jgi:predicted metal-dependent phosphotriesterase family hydrolase
MAASVGAHAAALAPTDRNTRDRPHVMTVRGSRDARTLGFTLSHEHALVNFQPYEEWARQPHKYDREEVVEVVLPYLTRVRALGCRSFVDPTPPFLGRDAEVLRRLSEKSNLHILTATGNYAAREHRHLPPHVFTDSPAALAQRWIEEWEKGIEGTGVKPGLMKLGFNGARLTDVERRLIDAAAIAHRKTGLTIAAHTGPAVSAFEQLERLESAGVHPSAWIWIHAQQEQDLGNHITAARRGAWISFDGVSPESTGAHVDRIIRLRDAGLLKQVLVSQDAGWYNVGDPRGGKIRPFDTVFTTFIPALRARGFSTADIDTLFVNNPARAFAVAVRS